MFRTKMNLLHLFFQIFLFYSVKCSAFLNSISSHVEGQERHLKDDKVVAVNNEDDGLCKRINFNYQGAAGCRMVPGFRALLAAVTALWLVLRLSSAGFACLSNPCIYGICIDDLNSTYTCYCIDGYTGIHCQTNWDECWSSPCLNGGTCHDGIAAFNCSCPPGFLGDLCEENVDECSSNPCLNNATCLDVANGYTCQCLPGYSGIHCEVDIAVCNSTEEAQCHNGAMCVEGPGMTFTCICTPGWKGKQCNEVIDECASNPCQNGAVCIDMPAGYACACLFGFTGHNCDTELQICEMSPCENNALCLNEDGMSVCYCVPDYHGERCQFQYDECQLGPRCWNGGTCIDGVDNYTCSCPPKLTGRHCECLILDDNRLDCTYKLTTSELPFTTIHYFKSTTERSLDDRLSSTSHFLATSEFPISYVPTISESALSTKTEMISKPITEYSTISTELTEFTSKTTISTELEQTSSKFTTVGSTEYFTTELFSNLTTPPTTDLTGKTLFISSVKPRFPTEEGFSETTMLSSITETTESDHTDVYTTESFHPQVRTDHEMTQKESAVTTEEPPTKFVPSSPVSTVRTDRTVYHSTETEITKDTLLTTKHVTEPSEHTITVPTLMTVPIETATGTSFESTIEYSTSKPLPEISTHYFTTVTKVESETETSYGIDVDCSKLPCLNGGKCVVEKGLAKCSCQFGWTGFHCEEHTGIGWIKTVG